jgi:glycosyltransferase involved in cell wall biosynthesis
LKTIGTGFIARRSAERRIRLRGGARAVHASARLDVGDRAAYSPAPRLAAGYAHGPTNLTPSTRRESAIESRSRTLGVSGGVLGMSKLTNALRALRERARPSRLPRMPNGPSDLRVQLTQPIWTVHRSTDREYVYGRFARLGETYALRFAPASAADYVYTWNARYVRNRAREAFGLRARSDLLTPVIRASEQPDVVFAYGEFPRGFAHTPVLWEHTFAPQLDADEASYVRDWRARASPIVEQAARVVTATDVSAEWFARMFPAAASKVRSVPYYLPELAGLAAAAMDDKQRDSSRIRLLFVGKQARRKGLLQLVAAWERLDRSSRAQLEVQVVSAMLDGPVTLPAEWHWQAHVPDVQVCMRRAHVLVHPALSEAFGLVLVEAMAAGCLVITTHAPIQRSIVGAQAGVFVDPRDPEALAAALRALLRDPAREQLRAGMRASLARFHARYRPELVARQYADLLWETAGRSGPAPLRAAEVGP